MTSEQPQSGDQNDVNVWLLPSYREILVTDEIGGVPVDACDWPEIISNQLKKNLGNDYSALWHFKGQNSWSDAVKKANDLKEKLGAMWSIKYDNWIGRQYEYEEDF